MQLAMRKVVGRTLARTRADNRGEAGATATEYALLVALVAIAIVGGITVFGSGLDTWFSTLAAGLP